MCILFALFASQGAKLDLVRCGVEIDNLLTLTRWWRFLCWMLGSRNDRVAEKFSPEGRSHVFVEEHADNQQPKAPQDTEHVERSHGHVAHVCEIPRNAFHYHRSANDREELGVHDETMVAQQRETFYL